MAGLASWSCSGSVRPLLRVLLLEPLKSAPSCFSVLLVALPAVDFPEQIVGLSVGGIKRCGLLKFPEGLGVFVLLLEKRAHLVVRLRESRVILNRFPQILLSFFRARQLHQERARIESGPRRRRAAWAVETNRLLIRLDSVIIFSQGLVAEPEVVVSLHEIRVELDRLTRMDDSGAELLRIVVQARKPVGIERVARVRAGELVEFRARPVSMVKRDIGHGQSEPAALIERTQRLSFLHGDGRIEIFPVEKKNSARENQQRSRLGIMVDLFHQNRFRA